MVKHGLHQLLDNGPDLGLEHEPFDVLGLANEVGEGSDVGVVALLDVERRICFLEAFGLFFFRLLVYNHALADFADHIQTDAVPHAVIIDCSASEAVAAKYADWMERGIHVITPNKKANSNDFAYYKRVKETASTAHTHYLYETTVGAGLPIIQTLQAGLLAQQDDIQRSIERLVGLSPEALEQLPFDKQQSVQGDIQKLLDEME